MQSEKSLVAGMKSPWWAGPWDSPNMTMEITKQNLNKFCIISFVFHTLPGIPYIIDGQLKIGGNQMEVTFAPTYQCYS